MGVRIERNATIFLQSEATSNNICKRTNVLCCVMLQTHEHVSYDKHYENNIYTCTDCHENVRCIHTTLHSMCDVEKERQREGMKVRYVIEHHTYSFTT